MAKSNNPLPKVFTAWYTRSARETLLATCSADNGWYRIFAHNTFHNLSYRSYRWHELVDMIHLGRLVLIDAVPEDEIGTMEELI